jgi:hypothetical protein
MPARNLQLSERSRVHSEVIEQPARIVKLRLTAYPVQAA